MLADDRRSGRPLAITDGYDVTLADRLTRNRRQLVGNDLRLAGTERLVAMTDLHQGGKTTYARMIGQLHHLAVLGLTVPASHPTLPLPDLSAPTSSAGRTWTT